jgi:GMP synthase (glutamine-hydrolysing)
MVIIINLGSKKTPNISEVLTAKGIQNKIVSENEFSITEIENAKALILSGSPVLLSEIPGEQYNEYLIKYDFIKSIKIPVLGICFGHQLIGILHGSRIDKCTPDRDWQTIKLVSKHPAFEGFDPEFQMKQDHQEHITVPPHFIHLGTSVICENEAMAHPIKKMVSVQFHPEVSEQTGSKFFDQVIQYFGLINN